MPLQSFVDGSDPKITAAWLNAIDAFYVTLFSSSTTAAAARTALGSTSVGDAVFIAANAAAATTAISALPLSGGTLTGDLTLGSGAACNDTKVTLASHATTGDIWGTGGVIDWTGTATTTAFPAAPTAGAQRLLICAGACKFIAGANLLIEGITSGTTVTMKANALVNVLAITTTQFKLTYSLTGSVVTTTSGFTSEVTPTVYYRVVNGLATIYIPTISASASDATSFTIATLPAEVAPSYAVAYGPLIAYNNSGYIYTANASIGTNGVITLYATAGAGGWTAANNKGLNAITISYLL